MIFQLGGTLSDFRPNGFMFSRWFRSGFRVRDVGFKAQGLGVGIRSGFNMVALQHT